MEVEPFTSVGVSNHKEIHLHKMKIEKTQRRRTNISVQLFIYIGWKNFFNILPSLTHFIMPCADPSYPMGKMMGKGRRRPGRGIQRKVGDRFWRIERYSLKENCMLILIVRTLHCGNWEPLTGYKFVPEEIYTIS